MKLAEKMLSLEDKNGIRATMKETVRCSKGSDYTPFVSPANKEHANRTVYKFIQHLLTRI